MRLKCKQSLYRLLNKKYKNHKCFTAGTYQFLLSFNVDLEYQAYIESFFNTMGQPLTNVTINWGGSWFETHTDSGNQMFIQAFSPLKEIHHVDFFLLH